MNSNISIIVAASENNCIGLNTQLPWHLSADLKRFKEITFNSVVIMGRRTYESIGGKLPNRINVIATRENNLPDGVGVLVDDNVWENINNWSCPVFIIGGAQIYKQGFKYANTLYLTRVHKMVYGDTYLEGFNEDEWELVESDGPYKENEVDFTFLKYVRK